MDLAVGDFGANTVVILKNDGSGTFTPLSTIAGQVDAIGLVSICKSRTTPDHGIRRSLSTPCYVLDA